jgi:AcrR family transcriptional regulator
MKRTAAAAPARPRGRPRAFDRDTALERAMEVFWQQGYESTSIADLTKAMGINPPSLYAAFGDKERLFLEAIERYRCGLGGNTPDMLASAKTARQGIQRLLEAAACTFTDPCHPPGCMMMTATTTCSAASEHLRAELAKRRVTSAGQFKTRIQRGIKDGELPAATDAAALGRFYVTVLQGMSMQARDGASRKSLLAIVAAAMRAWPGS